MQLSSIVPRPWLASASCVALLALSCKGGGDSESKSTAAKGTAGSREALTEADSDPAAPAAPASPIPSTHAPHRVLIDEMPRAELSVRGLFIDFGTPDQHKYTRGGWHTGWGSLVEVKNGPTLGAIDERKAELHLLLRQHTDELVLRMRSGVSGQHVTISADNDTLGSAEVPATWSLVRVPATSLPAHGLVTLELSFRNNARHKAVAEVDWMWLRSAAEAAGEATANEQAEAPPADALRRVADLELGGTSRRSMVAPTPRTFAFYLQPPNGAELVFEYGSGQDTQFSVDAETVDGEVHSLFSEKATPNQWKAARVDLAPFVGKAIRLALTTRGAGARVGWAEPTIVVPAKSLPPKVSVDEVKRPKNIVFVTMDTCRADMYSTVNPDSKVLLPKWDAFAKRSTTFAHAYDNESWTKPSTTTLLSGLYPHTHNTYYVKSVVPDEVLFLSEHLRANGFQTAAISANPFVKEKHGFEQGWDYFECTAGTDRTDGKYVFADALDWIKEHAEEGRFLMYIQSMDCHSPYEVDRKYTEPYHPEPYNGQIGPSFSSAELGSIMRDEVKISEADWKWVRALYYGDASYHDEKLGEFLDHLDELGLLDDTMVALTNDHGEELNDHGSVGHTWTSHEELIRSPLLFYYPPLFPAGRTFDEVVETVDLSPTIADALGVPPLPDADGASLLPLTARIGKRLRPYYAITDHRTHVRVVHVGRWRLKVDYRTGWVGLWDLKVDPGEHVDRREDRNLAGWMCEVYLGEALAAPRVSERLLAASRKHELRQKVRALDADTKAELEAAGYIDGTASEDHEKK